ncbi:MAG TPA: NAD(P)/FAD-dependent oxidoreductase [Myxococcota bacterium]|nr:NAD(P)/FAD-dependent oxidoreductase [Myxococcota bacterium]
MTLRALVVGGGHNGLVCAAYLARAGLAVTVLERRPIFGGACVTEELWPGYRVSRAAYVLSLFRPQIAEELELARHGLRLLTRSPSSITPLPDGRALVLGQDARDDFAEIEQFSRRDAERYRRYELWLEGIATALEPLLDDAPPHAWGLEPSNRARWRRLLGSGRSLARGPGLAGAARVLFGSARAVLEDWFESEPLRATLATDAIIGAFAPPSARGTGYVLFHHVMGRAGGQRGVWAYVAGGMGALSDALAAAARAASVELRANAEVAELRVRGGRAAGVVLASGEALDADVVLSNADPARTAALVPDAALRRRFPAADFASPVVKLNLALGELPRFRPRGGAPLPLTGTIHLGPTDLDGIERAFADAAAGEVSELPVVELTIPSVVDPSLAPPGKHVASIFAQYAPALAAGDARWPELRERAERNALRAVESLAPGFTASIEHLEVLAAPDLERVFALTGGNIFHGAMRPERLLARRPSGWLRPYRTPLPGLWLCGSGTHPGGGVMGAPGRNAALELLASLRR